MVGASVVLPIVSSLTYSVAVVSRRVVSRREVGDSDVPVCALPHPRDHSTYLRTTLHPMHGFKTKTNWPLKCDEWRVWAKVRDCFTIDDVAF